MTEDQDKSSLLRKTITSATLVIGTLTLLTILCSFFPNRDIIMAIAETIVYIIEFSLLPLYIALLFVENLPKFNYLFLVFYTFFLSDMIPINTIFSVFILINFGFMAGWGILYAIRKRQGRVEKANIPE